MASAGSSSAGPCGIGKKWNEFSPEFYSTDVIKDHSNYENKPGAPAKSKKPSILSKIKNIIGIILIVEAVIAGAVIIFIVAVKISTKIPYCNEKHPSFVEFGRGLCNKKYREEKQKQNQEIKANINMDDIKEAKSKAKKSESESNEKNLENENNENKLFKFFSFRKKIRY